jgi:hypothetical protein
MGVFFFLGPAELLLSAFVRSGDDMPHVLLAIPQSLKNLLS